MVITAAGGQAELKRTQAQGRLQAAEKDRSLAAERGQEAAANAEAALGRLRAALGEVAPGEVRTLAAQLQKEEEAVSAAKQQRDERARGLGERIRAAELEQARQEAHAAAREGERAETAQALAARLRESGFADEAEAEALRGRCPDAAALAREIEAYDGSLARLNAGVAAVEAEGEIVPVEEEEYARRESAFRQLTQKKEDAGRQSAVLESAVAQFAGKLARRKELEKERDGLRRAFSDLERLRSLLYGNKFMEFVAGEYLADISESATELLLKLTNGRYFIRYEQGFFVGDNFNGGELRSVNTLSGGETFLVSLSLALALSAAIYAKSLRPIEFFFLDEGFGTLDEKLIDTVMDSLEKLKNKHFAIGLISHVEELKHRIDNKIVVTAASESGGSTIKISC